MRFIVALGILALPFVPLQPVRAQQRDYRFEITSVGDSTITFKAGRLTWVVRSPSTIVVDPRRRDALVARLKVLSLSSDGEATALVTGQAGRITTDHFVIAVEPPSRWYRSALLWVGTAFGLAAGFALGRM